MKITLNIPDSVQQDLVKLGARLEIPMEEVVVSCMSVGCSVIQDNPMLQDQLKEHWKGQRVTVTKQPRKSNWPLRTNP